MKIAILGGTGKLGMGLALRLHRNGHEVLAAGDATRKRKVMELIRSMKLNPIDAGALEAPQHLEHLTVLLLSINKANKVRESGIRMTGI